jgi:hypothetical protein
VAGVLALVAGVVTGALAWFTAWGTFEPGFGFEAFTVPAALMGLGAVAAILVGAILLDRPLVVSVLCLVVATVMFVAIYQLSKDIPGAWARRYPAFRDEYDSRVQALWLAGASATALTVLGLLGLRRRHGKGNLHPNRASP